MHPVVMFAVKRFAASPRRLGLRDRKSCSLPFLAAIRAAALLAIAAPLAIDASAAGFKMPSIDDLRSLPGKLGKKKADQSEAQPAPEPPAHESPANAASPASGPGARLALVTVPPPPPGSEFAFEPIGNSGFAPLDPAVAAQREAQRAEALLADLRTIAPINDLPTVGSAEFAKLRAEALAIVKRRFAESQTMLEADTAAVYRSNVTWAPNFEPSPRSIAAADRDKAIGASYGVAYTINHLDRPRFLLAFAAAVFALDPESVIGAENAASAILASGERLYPNPHDAKSLAAYRQDASVVYRYALAKSVENDRWTLRSLGVLVNLGNLYVDMKDAERARRVLLAAKAYAPESWEAALALASCYEMQGRPQLARAALEDNLLAKPALFAATAKGSKNLDTTHAATELSPDSPDAAFEAVMDQLDSQEIMTAADFVDGLDQSERNRMRSFVDNLPVQGSYRPPGIDGLTQFSTLESISKPLGIQALGDFAERLGSYSLLLYTNLMQQSTDMLSQLGINVQYNVDIKDVMANPHKYQNQKIEATVTGADQARARAEANLARALQARQELESGKTDTLISMASAHDPALAVYALKPADYANPMDVLIQQYNMTVLGRKLHTYNAYFFAVNGRARESLAEISEIASKKHRALRQQEDAEMAAFEKRKAAAAAAGQDVYSAEWRLAEHNIHRTYAPQYNAVLDQAWKQATQTAGIAYEQKIKRRAERFYYDVFRHVALISDPEAREKKAEELARILHFGVYTGLVNALMAFGSYEYVEDWDCGCDVGGLLAQSERERKELERISNERFARERQAKLRFASGELPESSPLFKKLDAYGTDLSIPFIPFLSGRISCARTSLNLSASFPSTYSPSVNYSFNESAFSGATTHSGGIGVGVKATDGSSKLSAKLNLKGSVAIDGKGVVSDYSVTAASKVEIEMGPTSVGAGGEITYTPKGGLNSDVSATAKTSFSDAYGRSIEVAIEASAQRGSTFTAKAEQEFNPYADQIKDEAKEIMGNELNQLFPVDTSIKKEIWSGSYKL